jgi:hypothetical protein
MSNTQLSPVNEMSNLVVNQTIRAHDLVDKSEDDLHFLISECNIILDDLKSKMSSEYDLIMPSLQKIIKWKNQAKVVQKKLNTYEHFLIIEESTVLINGSDDEKHEETPQETPQEKSKKNNASSLLRYPPHVVRSIHTTPPNIPTTANPPNITHNTTPKSITPVLSLSSLPSVPPLPPIYNQPPQPPTQPKLATCHSTKPSRLKPLNPNLVSQVSVSDPTTPTFFGSQNVSKPSQTLKSILKRNSK